MKNFKAICAATVLALSLSISIYADNGEVHTPGKNCPVATCGAPAPSTTEDREMAYSVLADIVWAVVSIF